MRASAWRITWNPSGATPRVLLDFGDLMDDEIARGIAQAVDVGRFDQAATGRPYGRGNRKRRLEFGRVLKFDTAAESWVAMLAADASDPWGEKQSLQVDSLSGPPKLCTAALPSVTREIVSQPFVGYRERHILRVSAWTS